MAEKRMFNKKLTDSDEFLDMPAEAQMLYFHLSMHADDEGFVYPKSIMRMIGAKDDSLKLLIAKRFVIYFNSGVIVIRHWRLNNYLRKDRHTDTQFLDEYNSLKLVDKVYEEKDEGNWSTTGIPLVTADKIRLDKSRLDKNREESNSLRSLSSSCSEPSVENSDLVPQKSVFIEIETNKNGVLYPVTDEFVAQMKELYPAVDVEQELRKMKGWAHTTPSKRKTYRGMPKFINNWLSRKQDNGGSNQQEPQVKTTIYRNIKASKDSDLTTPWKSESIEF